MPATPRLEGTAQRGLPQLANVSAAYLAEPAVAAQLAEEGAARGFKVHKIKARPWDAVDHVKAIHAAAGDALAIRSAGAYGAVMASTYNSRALVPEVMVNGEEFAVIRRRVTTEAYLDYEDMPDWQKGD